MTDPGRLGIWTALEPLAAEESAAFAERVEELGYGALWMPETLGRDPFSFIGHLVGNTTRLVFGTGIASIWNRLPSAARAATNTLAEVSGGRFILGLGVSHHPLVQGVLKLGYDKPLARMRAYLEAYAEAPYMGRAPENPAPVLVAALRRRMLELSAEKADGAFPYLVPPEHIATARAIVPSPKRIVVTVPVAPATEPTAARETARAYLNVYLGLPNYLNNLKELGFTDDDLARPGSDRLCDAIVAWGGPDRVRARITEMYDAGADHVCLIPLLDNGFMPNTETVEAYAP